MEMVSSFQIPHRSSVFPVRIIGVSRISIQVIFSLTYITKCRKSSTTRLHGRPSIAESWSATWRPLRYENRYVGTWMCCRDALLNIGIALTDSSISTAFWTNHWRRFIWSHIPNLGTSHYKRRISSYSNAWTIRRNAPWSAAHWKK